MKLDVSTALMIAIVALMGALRASDIAFSARLAGFFTVVVIAVISNRQWRSLYNPIRILTHLWLVTLGGHFANLIVTIRHWPSVAPTAYLVLYISFVVLGANFASAAFRSVPIPSFQHNLTNLYEDLYRHRQLLLWASIAGFVASGAFVVEMVVFHSVNVFDPADTRAIFVTKDPSLLTYITLLTRAGGTISLLVAIVCWERIRLATLVVYIASGLSLSALAFFAGGRFALLQITMVIVFAHAARASMGLKAMPSSAYRQAIIGLIVFNLAYSNYVSAERGKATAEGLYAERPYEYGLVSLGLEINEELLDMGFASWPLDVRNAIVNFYGYCGLPIEHFVVFWNVHEGLLGYGAHEVEIISRNLHKIFPVIPSGNDILEAAYQEFMVHGESGYTWQTAVRDNVIDFGEAGGLICAFLFGLVTANEMERLKRNVSFGGMFRLLAFWMVACHSTMYTLLGEASVLTLLILPSFMGRMTNKVVTPDDRKLADVSVP